jgi:hypothetical protein
LPAVLTVGESNSLDSTLPACVESNQHDQTEHAQQPTERAEPLSKRVFWCFGVTILYWSKLFLKSN